MDFTQQTKEGLRQIASDKPKVVARSTAATTGLRHPYNNLQSYRKQSSNAGEAFYEQSDV